MQGQNNNKKKFPAWRYCRVVPLAGGVQDGEVLFGSLGVCVPPRSRNLLVQRELCTKWVACGAGVNVPRWASAGLKRYKIYC